MKNKVIIYTIIALCGFGIGYQLGENKVENQAVHQNTSNAHVMTSMNAELRGKTGDTFDQAFLAEMIIHHQGAVEMSQLALTKANHQEIKDLANVIITAQNKEIEKMEGWHRNWFGE